MDTTHLDLPAQVDPLQEPRSPLYLAPECDTWVGVDGPALRVSQTDCAERLYPLRRIGRIHTNLRVEWEQDALLACAQAGIPVLFLDNDGLILARLLGRPGQRDELRSRLIEFLLRPESEGMLHYWIERNGQRAARWAGIKLGLFGGRTGVPSIADGQSARNPRGPRRTHKPPASTRAGAGRSGRIHSATSEEIRVWLEHMAQGLVGPEIALRTRQWLRGLAYAWMEEHLADLGFARTTEIAQSGQPPLAANLTEILFWYLEPARIGWLARRSLAAERKGEPLRPPTYRETVALFESRAARAAVRGREITGCLHRWLIHECN